MAKAKYHKWLEPENLILIEGWARDGLTELQIAKNMGASLTSLKTWKNANPPIMAAITRGKEVVDREVENALQKSAVGYFVEESKTYIEDIDGRQRRRVEKIKKWIPANPTSQIYWLKNRKPKEWRDRKETEISGSLAVNNPFEGLTTEELRKIARSEKQ